MREPRAGVTLPHVGVERRVGREHERRDERGPGAEQRIRPPREPVAHRAAAFPFPIELADAPRHEHTATGVADPAPRHEPQRATARGI